MHQEVVCSAAPRLLLLLLLLLPPGTSDVIRDTLLWCRYQSYFDVDTDDVVKRMVDSLKGPLMPHFLNETRSNPDL